ncbi:MAG: alpha-amylase [Flavobacteriaceae bacterium]|nr:alpha-amylase [Flavobacteriaceae bacterium]
MKKFILIVGLLLIFISISCNKTKEKSLTPVQIPFFWESANIYFLLTDRFNNADTSNDINFERNDSTAVLRGFEGGDIDGITQKIKEGYFTDLGINAIWMTPLVEQIHGSTDEGTGVTYGFHGYWTKDWTTLDPNFGTMQNLQELVETAHKNNIRIIMDAVINHTGPVTPQDPVWPNNWVRTSPKCTYQNYETSINCTLVENLPDILTESNKEVELPTFLIEKWKKEGRYDKEIKELDAFFERTGYPKSPRYYIIKWLTEYIKEFGIDGYRADTVRHIEEDVWLEFQKECQYSFDLWKKNNPNKKLDNTSFYTVGEVYGYEIIKNGAEFDFGDVKVNYYTHGFSSMINFEFKGNAKENYEAIFSRYARVLQDTLKEKGILNYVSSHDDNYPFDKERKKPFEAGTKLLLAPGTSQVYYGDEVARALIVPGTIGDATLRSVMNWDFISKDEQSLAILEHWQKLGKFRRGHPAIGAGKHKLISENPYVFQRNFTDGNYEDKVIVGLDLDIGDKKIKVSDVFKDGDLLVDKYSGKELKVKNGFVLVDSPFDIVLLETK